MFGHVIINKDLLIDSNYLPFNIQDTLSDFECGFMTHTLAFLVGPLAFVLDRVSMINDRFKAEWPMASGGQTFIDKQSITLELLV